MEVIVIYIVDIVTETLLDVSNQMDIVFMVVRMTRVAPNCNGMFVLKVFNKST